MLVGGCLLGGVHMASQAAPACAEGALKVSVEGGARDTATLNCALKGGQGYVLRTTTTSTLANATGKITYKVAGQSKSMAQEREQYVIGQFAQESESVAFWAPKNAEELQIRIAVDQRKAGASGGLELSKVTVVASSAYNVKWDVPQVLVGKERGHFRFDVLNRQKDQGLELLLTRATGETVSNQAYPIDQYVGKDIALPALAPGYYRVALQSKGADGKPVAHHRTSLVVLGEPLPQDVRVGVDSVLTWYGKGDEQVNDITDALKKIGVGALRERLSWAAMARKPNELDGGKYAKILALEKRKGFSLTATFHDSPSWAWGPGSRCEKSDRCPPRDVEAVARFGAGLGKALGNTLEAIEFWNEPNAAAFYGDSTAVYAQTLKAFSAGLGDNIKLLPGGSAGALGDFYKGVLRNNILPYVDAWNQHYYGPPEKLQAFLSENIKSADFAPLVDGKPMWLTETGASVRPDRNGSLAAAEQAQAVNLVKTYLYGLSTGFDRVYYFCAPHLLEDHYHVWGLFDENTAPRPALATLGAVSMVLSGRQKPEPFKGNGVVGFRIKGASSKDDAFVLWSESGGKATFEYAGRAFDLYGVPRPQAKTLTVDTAPMFVVGSVEAGRAKEDQAPMQARMAGATAARAKPRSSRDHIVVESVASGGKAARYDSRQNSYASNETGSFEVSALIRGAEGRKSDYTADCVPSKGWLVKDGARKALETGDSFSCNVAVPSELSGQGGDVTLVLKGKDGQEVDKVVLPLRTPVQGGKRTRLSASAVDPRVGKCSPIRFRTSSNLQVDSSTGAGECSDGGAIKATVKNAADTWIFAYLPLTSTPAVRAIYFEVTNVDGFADPNRNVLVQLVKKSGKVITITPDELKRSAKEVHYSASLDGHGADANAEVRIGWGRYWGQPGQRFGFTLSNIEVSNR